jgi:hypothetical protein
MKRAPSKEPTTGNAPQRSRPSRKQKATAENLTVQENGDSYSEPITRTKDCTSQPDTQKSAALPLPPMVPPRVYTSRLKTIQESTRGKLENEKVVQKQRRTQELKEARRKKDNERSRAKYETKLLQDAKDGGYTISEEELKKRSDAEMRKREVNWPIYIDFKSV